MDIERWLPVPAYEGLYEVSDLGNVRSLYAKTKPRKNGALLSPGFSRTNGHRTVSLWRDKKHRTWPVHQLVLLAFIGPRPAGMESLHGRGGNRDDRLVNLRYGTSKENAADRVRDGVANRGERGGGAKLTEAVVLECRRRYAAGETQIALAAAFGISQPAMSQLISGETWAHLPGQIPLDSVRHGRKGTDHHAATLTEQIVLECRRRAAAGEAKRALAREFGVGQATMQKAISGQTWSHLPYE